MKDDFTALLLGILIGATIAVSMFWVIVQLAKNGVVL